MTEHDPVIDTLRLSDALCGVGIPRDQADGVARALGGELAGRVTVRGDLEVVRTGLESKIDGVANDLEVVRTGLESKIDGVANDLEVVRTGLESKIDGVANDLEVVRTYLESKIDGVRSEVGVLRSDIKSLDARFTAKFNMQTVVWGMVLAVLSLLAGLQLFGMPAAPAAPVAATPVPPIVVHVPGPGSWTVPAGATQIAPDAGRNGAGGESARER